LYPGDSGSNFLGKKHDITLHNKTHIVYVTVEAAYAGRTAVVTTDAPLLSRGEEDKGATNLPPLDVCSTDVDTATTLQGEQSTGPSLNATLDSRVCGNIQEHPDRISEAHIASQREVGLSPSSANRGLQQNAARSDEDMQEVLKVLKKAEEFLKFGSWKNLVLILWNRVTNRKALTQYINEYYEVDSLKAGESHSGEFVVEFADDCSGPNLLNYFIEMFVSTRTRTAFCLYNISNKGRRMGHEIGSVYLLKRILNSAIKVKIMLSITYPSGAENLDREQFLDVVTQSATLVGDITKLKQSVALIVSEEDHAAALGQDHEVVMNVTKLLEGAKVFITEKYQLDDTSAGETENRGSAIQLIDALLVNSSNGYGRIGVLRQMDAHMKSSSGPGEGGMSLEEIIRDPTTFVEQDNESLQFRVSEELRNEIQVFAKYSNEKIRAKMALVGRDISKFFRSREVHTRDIDTLLHELQEAYDLLSDMAKNISQSLEPTRWTRTLFNALKSLEVNIEIDNFIDIVRQMKYLEILQIVSGHDSALTQTTQWVGPIRKIINEISDSKDWFNTLLDVREELLEPGIAAITPASHRGIRGVVSEPSSDRSSRQFMTEIGSYDENITFSRIDDVKLNILRSAARKIEKEKTAISCLDGKAVVARGARVALSEVLLYRCTSPVKSIEVFASDEVLVDADISKVGDQLQVRILAPGWRIKGARMILLNGAAGRRQEPRRAQDGRRPGLEGEDGKQGVQGGNAGSYFGISSHFVGDKFVVYSPNGGIGGAGQDGGNGAEGRSGDDPDIPSSNEHCDLKKTHVRFRYKRTRFDRWKWRWNCFCTYDFYEYEMYGSRGGVGGKGGNGGKGGRGGIGGHSKHIKLHDGTGSWDIVGRNGGTGQDGKGGAGGEGGRNGNTVKVQCKRDWYIVFSIYRWTRAGSWSAGRYRRGPDGVQGRSQRLTREPPKNDGLKDELSSVINRYKDYLISSLDDTINRKSLLQFIKFLGSDIRVQSTYDALALVEEMQTLENRFYQRRTDVDFLPFYESFLQRVSLYTANRKQHEYSAQYNKVLGYLYTATLSKIRTLRQSSARSLVTNMDGYLEISLQYIRKIEEISKLEAVARISNDYKEKINEKIISADDFINKEVLPEIEVITNETEANIDSLLLEIIEMRGNAKEEEKALRKKRKELENSLFYRVTSEVVNVISGALRLLYPAAHTAQGFIGQVNSVREDLSLSSVRTSIKLPQGTWSILQQQFDALRGVSSAIITALRHQIDVVLRAVAENPESLRDLEGTVKSIQDRLNRVGHFEVGEVRKLRDELLGQIKRKEEMLKRDTRDIKVTKRSIITGISAVFKILAILGNVSKVTSKMYVKYKENTGALEEIDRSIKDAKDRFEELTKYEDSVQNSLLPMIRAVGREMESVQSSLASKSKVSLLITSWGVQTALKEVKLHLRQFTARFQVQENLSRCIEKLDDAMTTLIDIYDRIEDYREQKQLVDYIADIASAGSDNIQITDRNLRGAISTLEKTINVNILFGQYENIVAAFKQWVFPFAELWLENFNLPSHRMINGTYEGISSVITSQIRTLKSKLTEYKTSVIRGVHSFIHIAQFGNGFKSAKPFYVWYNKRYRCAIMNLLAGKEVVLKADILYGVKENAVKFNVIEINFKTEYRGVQDELDRLLINFHVKLTHHGNSHYKCGNKFYIIMGDKQTIEYSKEKTGDGQPVDHNYVYSRLWSGDLLLSPYAMWSVRLVNVTNVNFAKLQIFGKFVDLELVGRGQYVSEGADICNQDLRDYYELDESFSELNRVVPPEWEQSMQADSDTDR
jgi:hypothetical protein